MLIGGSLLTALGLLDFGAHWLLAGAATVLVMRALKQPLVVPLVAERHSGPQRVRALAANAVWCDIGAGVGSLLAGVILPLTDLLWVYGLAGVALALSALACAKRSRPATV